ncbi:ImmA/IrrE family metallo-endopeptidase [Cupriavidus plantarum]|nr:hypothetical protein LMG26296_03673 [Cupriavidus plantarum]SMR86040.1 protein of unknown function [Cupriavidus plantarum]
MHEQGYAWSDKSGEPAAAATFVALERAIASSDPHHLALYKRTQDWWRRHSLRAADASALYPDVYFRRMADDIEISWLDRQPSFAPDGFLLALRPGYALLPVRAVAEPLWQFLDWATTTAITQSEADTSRVALLRSDFLKLRRTPVSELEVRHVGTSIQSMLTDARRDMALEHELNLVDDIPAIEHLDAAVLMFGGINVAIEECDVNRLVQFLHRYRGGIEKGVLHEITGNPEVELWCPPYEEGYRLAEEVRDELGIPANQLFVDIQHILDCLGIAIEDVELATDSVRGVAVAGSGFSPAIMVNTKSAFNANTAGRRFTLAHELCHILFDRTHARKISHVSGPWAPARTEKRANAFAAMFLASNASLAKRLDGVDQVKIAQLAKEAGIGYSALVEHLYNVDLIGDNERERLRGL